MCLGFPLGRLYKCTQKGQVPRVREPPAQTDLMAVAHVRDSPALLGR